MLPRLLALYQARGFEFVTLPEAESDEFYRVSTDLSLPPGVDTLEAAMKDRGVAIPVHAVANPKFEEMCR